MEEREKMCTDLVFSRSLSTSCREKVKDFWTFLDYQDVIKPYVPPKIVANQTKKQQTRESIKNSPEDVSLKNVGMWHDKLKTFQRLGLVKTALAADRTCKACRTLDSLKNTDLADIAIQPNETLNSKMEAFNKKDKVRKYTDAQNNMKTIPKNSKVNNRGNNMRHVKDH